jgi:hypothetical protein
MAGHPGGLVKIRLEDRLPFVTVFLRQGEREVTLDRVLLDTGSAATLFAVDEVTKLGIVPEPTDQIRRVVGVGGSEFVITKRLERLVLGDFEIRDLPIQVGAMPCSMAFPFRGFWESTSSCRLVR